MLFFSLVCCVSEDLEKKVEDEEEEKEKEKEEEEEESSMVHFELVV